MVDVLAVDLGKVRDWTAAVLLCPWGDGWACRYARRWKPKRDDCMDVLMDIEDLVERLHLTRPAVAMDAQGIGRRVAFAAMSGPLVDLVDLYPIIPCFSTLPPKQQQNDLILVGKGELLSSLVAAISSGRLVFSPDLEDGAVLKRELSRLREIPTRRGHGTTISHATGAADDKDDMAQALAMGTWLASRLQQQGTVGAIRPAGRRPPTEAAGGY